MLRRLSLALGLAATMLATSGAGAQTYKSEYKISTVLGAPHPWGVAAERWTSLVRESTQGRINMKAYPGVSLVGGDQTREFAALRQGVIDMAIGSTINWSSQVRALNLFSLPFLMPDARAMDSIIQGDAGRMIFQEIEKAGVQPLAWGESGFRQITNSVRAVRTPDDMKGLKIRVVGSPLFNDTFTALGANPTQMSFADLQPALATGAVDGQENPVPVIHASKMWTLNQKHMTLWSYVADPLIFVINKQAWNSFSEQDRKAVQDAARIAGRELIAAVRKGITPDDDSLLREIEGHGVQIVRLSAAELKPFQSATRSVYDKWAAQVGKDIVAAAETAIAAR